MMIYHMKRYRVFSTASRISKGISNLKIDVLTDEFAKAPFLADWTNAATSCLDTVVALPKSTKEVADLLKYCNEEKVPIVPQGGNTNLVHSSISTQNGSVLISLLKLDKVIDVNKQTGVMICEAGCVLENLEKHLSPLDFLLPIDLGSKGSCTIGGNVSTNAGGLRYARYGSLKQNILGMEVVLPSGEIMEFNTQGLKKNSTGYDLKQLFIGAEGTLGVVTKAVVNLARKPSAVNVCLLGFESFENLTRVMSQVKHHLSEVVSAVEFWDKNAMKLIAESPQMKNPFNMLYPFYLLVETNGSNDDHDTEKLMSFIESVIAQNDLFDDEAAILAKSGAEVSSLWAIRENFSVALRSKGGYTLKSDISFPKLETMNKLTQSIKTNTALFQGLQPNEFDVSQYGHINDGNVHLEVWFKEKDEARVKKCEDAIYDFVLENEGSISAEHGIGLLKKGPLRKMKSKQELELMRQVKRIFDPNGIMNPDKIF